MTTNLCQPSSSCVNLRSWRAKRPEGARSVCGSCSEEQPELQAYIEACHMLIRSTAVRCMLLLGSAVAECKLHGQWPAQALEAAKAAGPSSPRPTAGAAAAPGSLHFDS